MPTSTLKKLSSNPESLERVLDNLKEGVVAHDLNRRIFFFNREAERITGFDRSDVLGKDCHDAFETPFCGNECSFLTETPQLGNHREYQTHITTQSGQSRLVEMSVTMMQDEDGQPFGVLASIRDITDLFHLKMTSNKAHSFANIIGQDIKMLNIFKQIEDLYDYDYPAHISGETGTGKELVAAAIHKKSHRTTKPFVPINCGALPEGLIESELFGHVKGAFSGAIRDKKGRFELAEEGTIFLDEVAELSKHMQVKLLRFLQEKTFEKVGGEHSRSVDVRIISATNKDLKKEVEENRFREDLYYRLNVIPIFIPPLRDRKTDIPLLVDHFLREASMRHGQKQFAISKAALSLMMDYPWPGNVRQLQNTIQYAIVKCSSNKILPGNLPFEVRDFDNSACGYSRRQKLSIEAVRTALEKTGGNKAKAAKELGVGRATLYRFLSNHPDTVLN
jgi:sigma-54 dependent transcriptional regulator, acetoin dehydrogenase operon transcriptional activator AcoR